MKPKILEHHVTIRKNEETKESCLCLEIAYTDSIGKQHWWFISDLPENLSEEAKENYLKTFLHAVVETEKQKKAKQEERSKMNEEYKELARLLANTKHDRKSMKKAVREFHDKKTNK